MKKIFFSLLAIAAIASCAKTEDVYTPDNSEIKIAPVAAMTTKANVTAAIDGTTYPTAENFDVYAYWANEPAGSTFTAGTVYLGDPNAVEFKNKGAYWGGVTTYYWPKNGSLRFSCYSPSSVDMTHDLATDTYTVEGYEQPNNTAVTWDLLVAPTSPSYTAQTAAENVAVEFQHALSWITIQVKAKDQAATEAFDLRTVTINDVNTKADFNATMGDGISVNEWSAHSVPQDYIVYSGTKTLGINAEVIENKTAGTLVIPQTTTSVTIDYVQKAMPGTPELTGQSITLPLELTGGEPWEPGKHYVYTLIFSVDEILINPSVQDWDDITVTDIETPKAAQKVKTADQLEKALANGVDVVLDADIVVEKTMTVNSKLSLNLNGKTLTNKVGNAQTDVLVVGPAGDLTIDGLGTIEAVTGNDGYAIISEGVLTINDGTYKSGVDAANNPNAVIYARGNGKVYVNGGYFPNDNTSKYVLNKKDGDRATTVIEVTGGTFGAFDPANNTAEGNNTNFVKDDYKSVDNGDGTYTVVKE